MKGSLNNANTLCYIKKFNDINNSLKDVSECFFFIPILDQGK